MLDDRRGSVGQAKGIIKALENKIDVVEKQIVYTPLGSLPNWIRGKTLIGVNIRESDNLTPPYPDLVLSTSRRTVPVARFIRQKSKEKTKIIQLMYPSEGVGLKDMALVIVPAHERAFKRVGKNIFVITGAPTRIFDNVLLQERAKWVEIFAHLPRPLTAVIIGGGIKNKPWPLENAEALADKLKKIHDKTGGSFLVTSSRRTGIKAEQIIMDKLKGIPMYTYLWGEKKENPIMGFYACADRIVVTADSVSMCSEACGCHVPVLLFQGQNWLTSKHKRFASSLVKKGYAQDIDAANALDFCPAGVLNPANEIAEQILKICQS